MSPISAESRAVGSVTELDSPALVMSRISEIERDLAMRQNAYESATGRWYDAQREIKKAWATALLTSKGTSVTAQKADADLAALAVEGAEYESEYQAIRVVVDLLGTRLTALQSLLKALGRS